MRFATPAKTRVADARTVLLLVAVLALVLAGPAAAGVQESSGSTDSGVETTDVPTVADIEFVGNERFTGKMLRGEMLTRASSWKPWVEKPHLDEDVLADDMERLISFYEQNGHYEAAARYELEPDADGRRVKIRIEIDEGPQIVLESFTVEIVDLKGAPPRPLTPDDAIVANLALVVGEGFSAIRYKDARAELLRRLANEGHPDARLEGGAEIDLASRLATTQWQVLPGPTVRFGEVEIEGLEKVAAPLLLREVTFSAGDAFSLEAMEATRQRISKLDLFRSIVVEGRASEREADALPGPETIETWNVRIRVAERPTRSLRLSVGYGTDEKFRARGSLRQRNFLGGGRRLAVSVKYSSIVLGGALSFDQPRLFGSLVDLNVKTLYGRQDEPAYDATRLINQIFLRRFIVGRFRARAGYGFERGELHDLKVDDPFLDAADPSWLSYFEFGLRRDGRDHVGEPTRGTWFDFSVRPNLSALGADASYVRVETELRGYVPVWKTVLAARAKFGTIEPVAGSSADEVPIFERYFSGGSTSVRGFRYHRLPPLDDGDDPFGGLTLAEGSLELRFPIWRALHGVVFSDAGQLGRRPSTLNAGGFFYTTGGGLRLATPIGPIRVDGGYIINPPDGIDRYQVYFSVGHAF